VCLLPTPFVKVFLTTLFVACTISLIIFIISLVNEFFGGALLNLLRTYCTLEYFSLYGNLGSTLLTAAKIVGSTATKKAFSVAAKGGGKLLTGALVIVGVDHVIKTVKLDQIASHAAVET